MSPTQVPAHRFVERTTAAILTLCYAVGLGAHLVAATRPLVIALTPAYLLACGTAVLVVTFRSTAGRRGALLLWFAAVMLVTFLVEVIGVATGEVFGVYRYGEVLGWKLADVPVVIGFNWALIILAAAIISDRIIDGISPANRPGAGSARSPEGRTRRTTSLAVEALRTAIHALLAGLIAALFDFILEPSAASLGYWTWQDHAVPLRNYAAWFLLAAGAGLLYRLSGLRLRSLLPALYLVLQSCFFVALNVGTPNVFP